MRGYNGKVVDSLMLDEYIQVVKNAITYAKLKATNTKLSQYLEQYELQKSGWDTFYKIKIKDIPMAYNKINESLNNAIDELKASLKHISLYFEKTNDSTVEFKTIFKNIAKKIKDIITKDVNIITLNFEAMQYEVGKKFSKLTENTAEKVVKKNISYKAIKEHSTFIKEISYGTDTYKIYETEYKNVSALNYGGSIIYVENGFFDLPKGYQLATLYHEIGHSQCKHFKPKGFKSSNINKGYDITIDDIEKISKQIKKDLNKFLFKLNLSPFSAEDRYQNGEEFLYLLLEWEADRFAADIVGKRLVRKSLIHDMKRILEVPMYKDPQKQSSYIDYNIDRTKIRNFVL